MRTNGESECPKPDEPEPNKDGQRRLTEDGESDHGGWGIDERYAANLHGVLLCFDRIIITGTLPGACDAGASPDTLRCRHRPLRKRIKIPDPWDFFSGALRTDQ